VTHSATCIDAESGQLHIVAEREEPYLASADGLDASSIPFCAVLPKHCLPYNQHAVTSTHEPCTEDCTVISHSAAADTDTAVVSHVCCAAGGRCCQVFKATFTYCCRSVASYVQSACTQSRLGAKQVRHVNIMMPCSAATWHMCMHVEHAVVRLALEKLSGIAGRVYTNTTFLKP
jgi:hypothetical protein